MAIEYHKHVFDNGLRVFITPMDAATSVTVVIGVSVGARSETPAVNGIAHFAEHMFFKGNGAPPRRLRISLAWWMVSADSSMPSPPKK